MVSEVSAAAPSLQPGDEVMRDAFAALVLVLPMACTTSSPANLPAEVSVPVQADSAAAVSSANRADAQPPNTPSEDPETALQLDLAQVTSFEAPDGSTRIIGLIENTGSVSATGIDIILTLLTDDGSPALTAQAVIKPNILRTGAKAPWEARIGRAPPFREIRAAARGSPLPPSAAFAAAHDLLVEGVTVQRSAATADPRIVGRITNRDPTTTAPVRVLGTIQNPAGGLIDVGDAMTIPSTLEPGATGLFEVNFLDRGDIREIPVFDLFIEGPGGSVAVSPSAWATVVPVTMLAVGGVGTTGLLLRRTPAGDPIAVLNEAELLTFLGGRQDAGGRTWMQIRRADGTAGWAADEYLIPH